MKVLICESPQTLNYSEHSYPNIEENFAIIKIRNIGICGTDIHAYSGNQAFFSYPRVLGHELSGEIVELSNSNDFVIGEKVCVLPAISCGKCIACRNGKPNCCVNINVIGVHSDGGMREYLKVPLTNIIPLKSIEMEFGAVVEPLAISYHAIKRASSLKGKQVLVMGCGPIGIGVAILAKLEGAEVLMLDINESRLNYCKDHFPIDHIVKGGSTATNTVSDITKNDLCQVVFDATGNKTAIETGVQYLSHGGEYIIVGIFNGDLAFNHPYIHSKEITMMSSRNAVKSDFEYVIDAILSGKIELNNYINYKLDFDQLSEKMDFISNPENGVIKAVVKVN